MLTRPGFNVRAVNISEAAAAEQAAKESERETASRCSKPAAKLSRAATVGESCALWHSQKRDLRMRGGRKLWEQVAGARAF